MLRRSSIALAISIIIGAELVTRAALRAESLKPAMSATLQAYEELQPYLTSNERFADLGNQEVIARLLKSLREGLHSAQSINSPHVRDPGFGASLAVIEDLLGDAEQRFKEGKKGYALYRLRAVSSNCASCHMSYSVNVVRRTPEEPPTGLNALEQAEFYLAARQFEKASQTLWSAMEEGRSPLFTIEALRKWLVLEIRVKTKPQATIEGLLRIQKQAKLPHDELEEISQWIGALKRWQQEPPSSQSLLQQAHRLAEQSMRSSASPLYTVDVINLLRASALAHRALATPGISPKDRSAALLLLGFSYYRLPLYFIDELPEIYFDQCIEEFPGSSDAKQAYRFRKEKVITDFTGSGGTHIPSDIAQRMKELYQKAYGVPRFEGQV